MFVLDTTLRLSCHVQTFAAISLSKFGWELNNQSWISMEIRLRQWNVPQEKDSCESHIAHLCAQQRPGTYRSPKDKDFYSSLTAVNQYGWKGSRTITSICPPELHNLHLRGSRCWLPNTENRKLSWYRVRLYDDTEGCHNDNIRCNQ